MVATNEADKLARRSVHSDPSDTWNWIVSQPGFLKAQLDDAGLTPLERWYYQGREIASKTQPAFDPESADMDTMTNLCYDVKGVHFSVGSLRVSTISVQDDARGSKIASQ
ncbi:hypothetical protein Ae201684_001400 [Aphanomyces euteiches]|uniref:Uncharacterized protein n=1 Tax=Aphanomyces euteiches TaxID=100861 RepID=A0A6G0XTH9_9STRA|nr:hypothetical protein Ae201684_001400 [Aphanomyces euteiches]